MQHGFDWNSTCENSAGQVESMEKERVNVLAHEFDKAKVKVRGSTIAYG